LASAKVFATVKPFAALLVILDTLNRGIQDENSNKEMVGYLNACDSISKAFDGCAVLIVHHTPHDTDRPRGHSSA
jgi:hypothetical protein